MDLVVAATEVGIDLVDHTLLVRPLCFRIKLLEDPDRVEVATTTIPGGTCEAFRRAFMWVVNAMAARLSQGLCPRFELVDRLVRHRMLFRGVTGSSYRSDMAVDDLSVTTTSGP